MDDPDKQEKDNVSFVRWQQKTIDERSKVVTLLLGMSLATIGFVISQLLKEDFEFENSSAKVLITLGSLLHLACILLLIWTTLNRLRGFRITTQIAKINYKKDGEAGHIDTLRKKSTQTDKWTHGLFTISLWLFAIAQSLVVVGFIIQVWEKL